VWEDYKGLVLHFVEAKTDCNRDKKKRCMYEGLHRKITSVEFLLDLGLMCYALQELSKLSLDLRECNTDFYRANKKIENSVKISEERNKCHRPYYENTITAAKCLTFKETAFHRKKLKKDPPICPNASYEKLKMSIAKRLLDDEEANLLKWADILDPTHWPEDVDSHLTVGEKEIRNLSKRLRLNERDR
jgi:hypothetical protein